MLAFVNRGGPDGCIRMWTVRESVLPWPRRDTLPHEQTPRLVPIHIVFEIAGNRYCRRIKRAHRSNHVFFVADLEAEALFQRCHDPDCSDYM